MDIKTVPISDIKPYENNPRKNEKAVDRVAASIREFGWKQPLVVDREGVIIAGHTRYKAAKKLGLDEVPVVFATDLSEEQVKAYRLADNKTAEIAEWDFDLLNAELLILGDAGFDMASFGFEPSPKEAVEDDFDVDNAMPEEPMTRRGDIWLLGDHRLMCGDCISRADVERLMDGQKARMICTDPPWNVNYGADLAQDNPQHYKLRTIQNDNMSSEQFNAFLNASFSNMKEICFPGTMVYVFRSAQEWGNMMNVMEGLDYHWSSTIIWVKDQLVLSRKDYHTRYEPIWYGWAEGARLLPLEDRKQSDVWEFDRPKTSVEHPTMKPVPLIGRILTNGSRQGDLVLDLFGGSGTTLIAAEQTGRICRMMELDTRYCDVIVKRYMETSSSEERVILLRGDKRIPFKDIHQME
jgi:DNA modification methylase